MAEGVVLGEKDGRERERERAVHTRASEDNTAISEEGQSTEEASG